MIKNLESQKEKLKKRLLEEVDEYFEKFEMSSNEEEFDINKIEALMIEQDRKIKKVLESANSELTNNVEVEVKKMSKMRKQARKSENGRKIKNKNTNLRT